MAKIVRWLLIFPTAIVAWSAAFFVGIVILDEIKWLCFSDQIVSGLCVAPWFGIVEFTTIAFGAALAAVLILVGCVWLAPERKREVAIATFIVGAFVAILMGIGSAITLVPMMAAVIAGGIVLAIMLRRFPPFSPPDTSLERTREK
jgi:hypothetical protein